MSTPLTTDLGSQQAFPHTLVSKDVFGNQYTTAGVGLTKRELFAAMAMQGMLADSSSSSAPNSQFASDAVVLADALLAALKETP